MSRLTVVIGPARAGKTTFSQWLVDQKGGKASGTSQIVYKAMAKARGCSVEELYKIPKESLRPHLIEFADFLCDIYPDILSEALIKEGVTIIDGIRRQAELDELRRKHEIEVFYVKRSRGTVKDNFAIDESCADFIVDNNGRMNEFIVYPNEKQSKSA